MTTTLQPKITQQGLEAVFNQSKDGFAAKITHVALGGTDKAEDKGYSVAVNNNGYATQTKLINEQQRVEVADGRQVGAHQIDISFIAEGEKSYWLQELGFYLEDGALFAIWSDPDYVLAWKSANVPLIIGLELLLSALPANSVTVTPGDTPLQLVMSQEIAALSTAIIRLQKDQLKQQLQSNSLLQTLEAQQKEIEAHHHNALYARKSDLRLTAPVGSIIAFADETAPAGWLECNGAVVSRNVYADLFAVIKTRYGAGDGSTTFNLPDLRGEFVRGWDHGRGVDSGRGLGEWQGDALQEHKHKNPLGGTDDRNFSAAEGQFVNADSVSVSRNSAETTGVTSGNHANETRPRNLALMYCIKY